MAIKISGNTVIDDDRNITANNVTFTGTGFVKVPFGLTAQRPNFTTDGIIRYNSSLNEFEYFSGDKWGFFLSMTFL